MACTPTAAPRLGISPLMPSYYPAAHRYSVQSLPGSAHRGDAHTSHPHHTPTVLLTCKTAGFTSAACGRQRLQGSVACAAFRDPSLYIDWRYYNLHLLFVDRTDTIRARLATGLFARVCDWNLSSNCLVALHCGLEPVEGRERMDLSTSAALMGLASSWRLRPQLFTTVRQQFEPEDIDRFHCIIAMDDSIQADILRQLSEYRPANAAGYTQRVCSLVDFMDYVADERLLQNGGSGLLDTDLRQLVRMRLPALRPALAASLSSSGSGGSSSSGSGDEAVMLPAFLPTFLQPRIPAVSLQDPPDSWERAILLITICCAGLHQYLIDARPDDLPEYDPVD